MRRVLVLLALCGSLFGQDFTTYHYGPMPLAPGVGSSWEILTLVFDSAINVDMYLEPLMLPAGISVKTWCASGNGGQYNIGWQDCLQENSGSHRWYQAAGSNPVKCYHVVLEIQAANTVVAGMYPITISLAANGHTHAIADSWIVAVPVVPSAPAATMLLPVPRQAAWISNLSTQAMTGATPYCADIIANTTPCPTDGGTFCYTNTYESLGGYRSMWYYDGASTAFSYADYLGGSDAWNSCGFAIADDFVRKVEATSLSSTVVQLQNETFQSFGLYAAWKRTSNQTQKARYANALKALVNQTPYASVYQSGSYLTCAGPGAIMFNPCTLAGDTTGMQSRDAGTRETALLGEAYMHNIMVGNYATDSLQASRARRNAEWLMFYWYLMAHEKRYIAYDQPFFSGVSLRFLVDYYEWSKDARVPAIVKDALDWTWEQDVDSGNYKLSYTSFPFWQQADAPTGFQETLCSVKDGGCGGTPYKVTFAGASPTGSAGAASATITLSGYTVAAADLHGTLIIMDTSGAGFIPGAYQILAVDTGANTVTLDRAATATAATGLAGYLTTTMYVDGTNISAAAPGAGSTLTLTGHTLVSGDVNRWFYVFSGTGTLAGRYNIVGVNTATNTITLDRAISTGATSHIQGVLATPRYDTTSAPGLLGPIYVWYWSRFGGEQYRERGFRIWNATVLTSWNGKELNQQNYSAFQMYQWAAPRTRSGSMEVLGRIGSR
jgi:hypothetical protein